MGERAHLILRKHYHEIGVSSVPILWVGKSLKIAIGHTAGEQQNSGLSSLLYTSSVSWVEGVSWDLVRESNVDTWR